MEFLTGPPRYETSAIYSISPDGKVTLYSLDRIVGFRDVTLRAFDPGASEAVLLLGATVAGQHRASSYGYYLVLFNYLGEVRKTIRLDLDFEPIAAAQLNEASFLVIGNHKTRARFVVVDDSGNYLREIPHTLVPSSNELKSMFEGLNLAGPPLEKVLDDMRLSNALSLLRLVQSDNGLLILRPGGGSELTRISRTGLIQTIKLKLPQHQSADSIVLSKRGWFVRTFQMDADSVSWLLEIDPETGEAIRKIDTSGVPATSIACATETGFYGLRWREHKPYLIFGEFR